jgi:adenylate cyclase
VEEIITVMFVDIRGFTARTQDMDPEQAVRLLNLFLGRMVAVVEEKHHGMINKFLGDGFMALFGIDEGTESQAVAAVAASIDLLEALKEVNREIVAGGQAPLSIGVGLHTGSAVVGSIGSPHRLEFTAIGATVNLASRIEALTKTLQVPILLTEAVRGHLPDDFAVRDFPPQEVKGVDAPVRVYSPVLPFP